ncbi:MAG TPA: porin [Polyangiaceae bacterium]|nr:porin [Polyangiaceae bacterium]
MNPPPVAAQQPELPPASAVPESAQPVSSEPAQHNYAEDLPPAADEDWYDAFDVRVFADAYYGLNYNFPKPQVGGNDVIRAFDSANGFALAWAGLDISHAADPVGGTLALRFGPSAKRYNTSCFAQKCDADYGLENVKQAFASWRPGGEGGPVTIDFGKFDTIYGAEVAESQDNINYTRGVLYWLGQPLFHTGLRVNAELGRNLNLRALAVNGWNNTVDNNSGKTFGLQATVHAPRGDGRDVVAASLGYLGGPERDDYAVITCAPGSKFDRSSASGCSVGTGDATGTIGQASENSKGWRHFVDLVVTSDPIEALHLVLNADFGVEAVRDSQLSPHFSPEQWWGAMLGARYLLPHGFAIGGRGEYYHDDDGLTTGSVYLDRAAMTGLRPIPRTNIVTGTLTVDYLPTKNLMLRLDNRLDHADNQIFAKGIRELTGTLVTTTLGVVVTTN